MSRERVHPGPKGYTAPRVHREHRRANAWARKQALQQLLATDQQESSRRVVRVLERIFPFLARRRRKRQAEAASKELLAYQAAITQQTLAIERARELPMRRAFKGIHTRRGAHRLAAIGQSRAGA